MSHFERSVLLQDIASLAEVAPKEVSSGPVSHTLYEAGNRPVRDMNCYSPPIVRRHDPFEIHGFQNRVGILRQEASTSGEKPLDGHLAFHLRLQAQSPAIPGSKELWQPGRDMKTRICMVFRAEGLGAGVQLMLPSQSRHACIHDFLKPMFDDLGHSMNHSLLHS